MRTVKPLLLLLLSGLTLLSCKKGKDEVQEQIDNLFKYREYISDISQGIISTHEDVRVVLRQPVADWSDNQELNERLFTVSPKVKGKVVALNNQTIAFVPEEKFEQDTEYNFKLKLNAFVEGIPSDLKEFSFRLKTLKQQFNVLTDNLQSYNKDWQYLRGTLRTSDIMNISTAKQLVKVKQDGKELNVKFTEAAKKANQFFFTIDSIQRLTEDSEIDISWDGSAFKIDSKGDVKILIPGKNNFTVTDIEVFDGESQYLEVNFSDPLKKSQNFDGLVSLADTENLKFSSDGNVLKVYPGREMKGTALLEIFEGIESTEGYKLKNRFSQQVAFEQIKPQVRLLQSGTILPSSNNLKVNFEAVNLRKVDVSVIRLFESNVLQFLQYSNLNDQGNLRTVARPIARKTIELQNNLSGSSGKWRAYALDLKEMINPEPGAIYRVEFNFRPSYSSYKCNATNFKEEAEENYDEETESSYWDSYENYYSNNYYYDYDWNERDNPCHSSYYRNKKVTTNVLASDLGLTVKKGLNRSYFVSVNDLVSTQPVQGARVTFYNFQQQEIGSVQTDTDGTSIFDSDNAAFFAVASHNNQKTYIRLNDGNALSVSKFDVSGARLQKGIKGFIYGERGVWRPGDTLFLSFMLNDKANNLPVGHPVKLELSDPYGKVTHREVKTAGLNNFYQFTLKTDDNAPTGNWTARVSVGGARFTKSLKIETIKPNRLKIKADFDSEILSSEKPVRGQLEVAWLHGAIAKNLKASY